MLRGSAPNCQVPRGRPIPTAPRAAPPVVGVPRPSLVSVTDPAHQPKRARKDRGPNWLPQEIFFLIEAKRDRYLEELDTVDGRDLMTSDSTKWLHVSQHVMQGGYSPILRDGAACKAKWNQLLPDYKRIADYLCRTGRNVPDYWELTAADRRSEGLPRQFGQDVFDAIHEWYGNRPQMQPPHVRDTLAPNDSNYRWPQPDTQINAEEADIEPDMEDPLELSQQEAFDTTEGSSPPRSPRRTPTTPTAIPAFTDTTASPSSRPSTRLPPGVTPHVISSSDTSQYAVNRRHGNTGVRRKSLSGHTVIAEATKASGALMAAKMEDIANASRDLERSKIEVQLKLFTEQMEYQREKDRRMYENAQIANENARLAILKQGEMVSCLSHLSTVLGRGMSVTSTQGMAAMAQPPNFGLTTPSAHFYASTSTQSDTIPNSTGRAQQTANTNTAGFGLTKSTCPSLPNSSVTAQQSHTNNTTRPGIHIEALSTPEARHQDAVTNAREAQENVHLGREQQSSAANISSTKGSEWPQSPSIEM